jgi:putative ABC transport system ATP-binding protein
MAFLEVERVSKIYESDGAPVHALNEVSLEAERGEWVALTGRSGCGKSTLLNLCGAMDFPSSGVIRIDGQRTTGLSDTALTRLRREKIGFIFQSFQLIQTLSVIENVEVPLLLSRRPNARSIANERLAWVELDGLADRLPHQLSGGQQQRVAIARALATGPSLILADEPTGNLDTATGESILGVLRRVVQEWQALVIMATHSPESAAQADRVIRMRDGRIAEIRENVGV